MAIKRIGDDEARNYGDGFVGGINPFTLFIRLAGVVVLLAGLYSAFLVIKKAWSLLDDPKVISVYADEIEKQTHMNAFIAQWNVVVDFVNQARRSLPQQQMQNPPVEGQEQPLTVVPTSSGPKQSINAAYLTAWFFTLGLLGLIARISLWAVSEGGKLIVYGVDQEQQLKRVLSELVQEIRHDRSSRAGT